MKTPRAARRCVQDYVRLAAPEPEGLRKIGEESDGKGTDRLRSRQIERAIASARKHRPGRV